MAPALEPPRLVWQHAGAEEPHVLDREVIVLGRAEDSDIVVNDPRASRRHAEVRKEGPYYYLVDLRSTNGTKVNESPVDEPYILRHGDIVRIADQVYRFVDPGATEGYTPVPLRINERTAEAFLEGQPLDLTPKEFTLLALLYKRGGEVVSKDEIAEQVWPEYGGQVADYNIEALVSRLRNKLEPDSASPAYILTVKRRGYRLALG